MAHPLGILALQIWRDDRGHLRARISSKLDAREPTTPEISYYTSIEELKTTVAAWVEQYRTRTANQVPQRPANSKEPGHTLWSGSASEDPVEGDERAVLRDEAR